jgi:hypothetical protein
MVIPQDWDRWPGHSGADLLEAATSIVSFLEWRSQLECRLTLLARVLCRKQAPERRLLHAIFGSRHAA